MNIGRIIDKVDSFKYSTGNGENTQAGENRTEGKTANAEPSKKEIFEAVEKLNYSLAKFGEKISFTYHEKTHRVIMRVIDPETEEVIREIPAKNAIKLLEHIQEFLGTFVDESR
ncbi:MAG: hypothetical protein CVV44_15870 [Spirochaetae bacterium HGW-Spirochaetae-1]|jgi:flagellar protein FlaG|nr:MAG: hypothetical protein CVV44_15870 [Spirochaetae bacterium HGW-Spirochaetae-1]